MSNPMNLTESQRRALAATLTGTTGDMQLPPVAIEDRAAGTVVLLSVNL